ncbi:sensor histidine kinase [Marinigracilibium pacificum]|uniref:histidine kinase n=1 Tax=Marinigracilibium pacificum TaxID=2729599 RepID=A0A848IZA7_9BACT|nr:HAMP domain-containing sensor histidine kinase [Marinigracilibium pacificum]NMM48701.1 HAMP domain-containing histidine kinase [Marinigracilibium pacificum]
MARRQNDGNFWFESNKFIRWVILLVAAGISLATIIYTNILSRKLKERETESIELFAKALEFVNNTENAENLQFVYNEIIGANSSVPCIVVDSAGNAIMHRNIDLPESASAERKNELIMAELEDMKEEHDPIIIQARLDNTVYNTWELYYNNSSLFNQLKYYPYVQLSILLMFGFLVYVAFSYSKKAQQNKLWVGLAKETAHQLGTPISSLIAWVEYFKAVPEFRNNDYIKEVEKDIERLELITERFSSIGSTPALTEVNLVDHVRSTIAYLQTRISKKVNIEIETVVDPTMVSLNPSLFAWVIENICKNAVDAMNGQGDIKLKIIKANEGKVFLDISDTGKGISKSQVKTIFEPGFTTKKRGWGLGLTLVKRIVESYHKGKIYIKRTEIDMGTTFRIILPSVNSGQA